MPSQTVAITGSEGFLGWHLQARLRALHPEVVVVGITRANFSDDALLPQRLDGSDTVIHLAGANRGPEDEVAAANVSLARRLTEVMNGFARPPRVVYANSIQAEGDSPYGRSKAEAGHILTEWGEKAGAPVIDLLFANLFGEGGRPNYNSAVATFAHDLIVGKESFVNPDGQTELLHAQDAAVAIIESATAAGTRRRVDGIRIAIPDVYARMRRLSSGYAGAHVPELGDRLDLRLFNVLRAAGYPEGCRLPLQAHRDARGAFTELARGHGQTQTSFSTSVPGITRGDHFHFDKIERFVVLKGQAVIKLRRLMSATVTSFVVSGDEPVAIDMPTLHTHNITNVGGDELVTIFWANDHFQPDAPDTYPEAVEPLRAGASI